MGFRGVKPTAGRAMGAVGAMRAGEAASSSSAARAHRRAFGQRLRAVQNVNVERVVPPRLGTTHLRVAPRGPHAITTPLLDEVGVEQLNADRVISLGLTNQVVPGRAPKRVIVLILFRAR